MPQVESQPPELVLPPLESSNKHQMLEAVKMKLVANKNALKHLQLHDLIFIFSYIVVGS